MAAKLTPRQKLINMMYLVLTALLALNVSVEVLEAFVTIDKSLERNIVITMDKNKTIMGELDAAYADNSQKVGPWREAAQAVRQEAATLYNEMQNLKEQIVLNGDEENEAISNGVVDPDLIADLGNTNVSSRIMVRDGQGAGYDLRKKIVAYREYLTGVVEKDNVVQNSIKNILNTDDPVNNKKNNTWETANFLGVPLISAVAILSKMQLDVLNCEGEVLNYLKQQIGAADFKFSDINVAVVPVTQYVVRGDEYAAEIFLAAYDPTQRPVLTIGGRTFEASDNGKILYKALANTTGPVNIAGSIGFMGPDGMTNRPVSINYNVVDPLAVASATKMNVFYRGVDNPVRVAAAGAQMDKLEARVSNGTITRRGNEYYVRPGTGNTCNITILVDGKQMGVSQFRVKDVPTPNPLLDGIAGKVASRGELMASQGVLAKMPLDFDFDLNFTVTSFVVSATVSNYVQEETSNNQYFTDRQKQIFNNLRPNQRVFITDIKARGPDGRVVDLSDIGIRVR